MSDLFKEPIILGMLRGKKAYVTLNIPMDEAYSHMRPLYATTKFDGQPVSRVVVDNRATLNVLLVSMLRRLGKKKSDMLLTNFIMINFWAL